MKKYNTPELKISMFSLNIKFRLDQLIRDLYENNI